MASAGPHGFSVCKNPKIQLAGSSCKCCLGVRNLLQQDRSADHLQIKVKTFITHFEEKYLQKKNFFLQRSDEQAGTVFY
jgi:hypothetical protein